jgi:hypothetical protein
MSAPDFYFGINAIFRHIHDRYGMDALVNYWRTLGREYYRGRIDHWRVGGTTAVAADWREYFAKEPGAVVDVKDSGGGVELDISVCPAIKHLREHRRDIVPYFCEHCDHVGGAMAEAAGFAYARSGGMGSCQQRFVRLTVSGKGR